MITFFIYILQFARENEHSMISIQVFKIYRHIRLKLTDNNTTEYLSFMF